MNLSKVHEKKKKTRPDTFYVLRSKVKRAKMLKRYLVRAAQKRNKVQNNSLYSKSCSIKNGAIKSLTDYKTYYFAKLCLPFKFLFTSEWNLICVVPQIIIQTRKKTQWDLTLCNNRQCIWSVLHSDGNVEKFTNLRAAASRRATWRTTRPIRMFLKTEMASEWDMPWRAKPFTARISSPVMI